MRTKTRTPRPQALRVALAALLLLTLAALAGRAPERVAADSGTGVSELETFEYIEIPARVDPATVRLRDELSGAYVTIRDVVAEGDRTSVRIPQLPVGTFTLTWGSGGSDERRTVTVAPEAGLPIELRETATGPGRGRFLILTGAGVLLIGAVLLRRNRAALLLLGVGASLLPIGLLERGSTPTVGDWETCRAYTSADLREQQILRRDCMVEVLVGMLKAGRLEAVRDLFATTNEANCHEVAHLAGFYHYRTEQDDQAIRDGFIPGCTDGLTHGVLEAAAIFTEEEEFAPRLGDLCADTQELGKRGSRTCFHGLGHAALWRTAGNLDAAWGLCEKVPDLRADDMTVLFDRFRLQDSTYSSRAECYSAAIMEWADRWENQRRNGDSEAITPNLAQPLDVCERGPDVEMFLTGCRLGTIYRTRDPQMAARYCNAAETARRSCFAVIGDSVAHFLGANIGEQPMTPVNAAEVGSVCAEAEEEDAASECAFMLGRVYTLGDATPTDRGKLCSLLPGRITKSCTEGVREGERIRQARSEAAGA